MLYNMYFTKIFNYHYLMIDKNEIKDSFIKIDTKTGKKFDVTGFQASFFSFFPQLQSIKLSEDAGFRVS